MAGDGYESFAAFVAARQRSLLRSATLLTGDSHLAQDLVQEALVKLAVRWDGVGTEHPEAYARQIMYRDFVSWRRRMRREWLGSAVTPPPVADSVGHSDDRVALEAALAQLTRKQRAVLVLRFYEDLSVEQTADLLRVSVGTVKSQSHAALSRLRLLAPDLDSSVSTSAYEEASRD